MTRKVSPTLLTTLRKLKKPCLGAGFHENEPLDFKKLSLRPAVFQPNIAKV